MAPACASLQSRITTTYPVPASPPEAVCSLLGCPQGRAGAASLAVEATDLLSHTQDMARLEEPLEAV